MRDCLWQQVRGMTNGGGGGGAAPVELIGNPLAGGATQPVVAMNDAGGHSGFGGGGLLPVRL